MSTKRCYYETLGCSRGASAEEIRRSYKREALKHHPDRNPGNKDAESRFKELNEAYQVLSDEEKRGIYDRFGHAGLEGAAAGFDGGIGDMFAQMQDLFSEMFTPNGGFGRTRGPRRGGDLRVQVRLTLKDAAFGCKRDVMVEAPCRCDECSGSGARKGTAPEVCNACRGTGQVSSARGFVMFTAPCQRCHGRGVAIKDPCVKCDGRGVLQQTRKVVVAFPPGIDAGQRLRVSGQGMQGAPGAAAGDLYVEVDVEEDARFERDGFDLITRVPVSFRDAVLGGEVRVPCLSETESPCTVTLPAGTQNGSVFTLKGHGIPRLDGRGRGALVAVVQVDVPTAVSERAKKLLEELDGELKAVVARPPSEKRAAAK